MSTYRLRHGGADIYFEDTVTLTDALIEQFKEQHVSVQFKRKSGMDNVLFVTVDENGIIRQSYDESKIINFFKITDVAQSALKQVS